MSYVYTNIYMSYQGRNEPKWGPATEKLSRLADDDFYRALAATPRRRLLYFLLNDDKKTTGELAHALATWDKSTDESSSVNGQTDIYLELIHNHLPVLSRAELISYDSDEEVVSVESLDPFIVDIIRCSVEISPE